MRIAVIDLGTNTFNLLIAETNGYRINVLINNKISVKLGKGGIGRNIIQTDAFRRGLSALKKHFKTISGFNTDKIIAFGTSALRTAENANIFINEAEKVIKATIKIISGQREAELIYFGVRQTLENIHGNYLILDIGGGSNEFILANNKKNLWKKSFKHGMARLLEKFYISDPIIPNEIDEMEKFFTNELRPLFISINDYRVHSLIGAEGGFESFYNMIQFYKNPNYLIEQSNKCKRINLSDYKQLHKKLLNSTLSERKKI